MKTLRELYSDCVEMIRVFELEREAITISPERADSAILWTCSILRQLLNFIGGRIYRDGELDRTTIALTWFSVMCDVSQAIEIQYRATNDGFMLDATIDRNVHVGNYVTRKPYTVRQLFFWNDSRPIGQLTALCNFRKDQLIEAIKTDFETN